MSFHSFLTCNLFDLFSGILFPVVVCRVSPDLSRYGFYFSRLSCARSCPFPYLLSHRRLLRVCLYLLYPLTDAWISLLLLVVLPLCDGLCPFCVGKYFFSDCSFMRFGASFLTFMFSYKSSECIRLLTLTMSIVLVNTVFPFGFL